MDCIKFQGLGDSSDSSDESEHELNDDDKIKGSYDQTSDQIINTKAVWWFNQKSIYLNLNHSFSSKGRWIVWKI